MRAASTSPASPSPTPCLKPRRGLNVFSPTARMATWCGWRRPPSGALRPNALWPDVRSVIMLGMNYGPDEDPLAILTRKDRAAISTYAKGDDYHELIKSRLKEIARWLVADCRRRRESVRRHRGGDGKAARGQSRSRLAGQAHQSGVARIRLVAVPRLDLHHARSAGGCRPSRTIAAPAAPVSTFVRPRRFRNPIGSMRGAASRI